MAKVIEMYRNKLDKIKKEFNTRYGKYEVIEISKSKVNDESVKRIAETLDIETSENPMKIIISEHNIFKIIKILRLAEELRVKVVFK